MIKFYCMRVTAGKKKWTEIPKTWQEDVIEQLKADGYTLNDDGTVSKS